MRSGDHTESWSSARDKSMTFSTKYLSLSLGPWSRYRWNETTASGWFTPRFSWAWTISSSWT